MVARLVAGSVFTLAAGNMPGAGPGPGTPMGPVLGLGYCWPPVWPPV